MNVNIFHSYGLSGLKKIFGVKPAADLPTQKKADFAFYQGHSNKTFSTGVQSHKQVNKSFVSFNHLD